MEGRKREILQGFNYSTDAVYFITICTQDKIHHFGKIENGVMTLNECGKIVNHQIYWLAQQYPYFEVHNFVVMPNHVHVLFGINRNFENENAGDIPLGFRTSRDLSLRDESIKIKSVSSLMGAYKTTVSKQIHILGNLDFSWQRSFYDHIVRTDERYHQIDNYITDNPVKWDKNKFYG